MRGTQAPRLNRDSVIGELYEEFLVTKQMATGSGEAWMPLAADGPGGRFKAEELGLSFDHGPSIFSNSRGLASKNANRAHKAHVGEHEKLARDAKSLGVKVPKQQPMQSGCPGCASCAPSSRKAHIPRRARNESPRWWLPGTKGTKRRGSTMGQRSRRPENPETKRRDPRARAKDAGVVVRDGQLVNEGTDK